MKLLILLFINMCDSFQFEPIYTFNKYFRKKNKSIKNEFAFKKKRIIIDIDGTICNTSNSNYNESIPKYENIHYFNSLYKLGHQVDYWTARGANSGINWENFTFNQLDSWGVLYTGIYLGKPHYDVWIDDKSVHPNDIF